MKIEGTFTIGAPRALVWELLNDPQTLARTLPGCERLVPTGPNQYETTITAGIAAIKGTYKGSVTIRDAKPPESCTLEIQGQGTGGWVRGKGTVILTEQGSDTQVIVNGDGQIGGPIATIGQRLVGSGARMMVGDFFRRLNGEARRRLEGGGDPISSFER